MGPMQPATSAHLKASDDQATSPLAPLGSQASSFEEAHEVIRGLAFPLLESGSTVELWAVQIDGEPGFHGVRCVGAGDQLTIQSPGGEVLFEGIIDPDYKTGSVSRSEHDPRPAIRALNRWMHWSQRGWSPDSWAKLFIEGVNRADLRRRRGELSQEA